MNLTVLQIQALSRLVRNVETMIELYWDTENGARLSQSLRIFRAACGGIALDQMDRANSSKTRLVVDAHCPVCGFLNHGQQADGLFNISMALEHTSAHRHVVILNGTVDLPAPEPCSGVDALGQPADDALEAPGGHSKRGAIP